MAVYGLFVKWKYLTANKKGVDGYFVIPNLFFFELYCTPNKALFFINQFVRLGLRLIFKSSSNIKNKLPLQDKPKYQTK